MEFYNNVLCVERDELVKYKGGEIVPISKYEYANWKNRRFIISLRHGGGGHPALYRLDRLPMQVKKAIKEKYGDPAEKAANKPFVHTITPDPAARAFFNKYITKSGFYLNDEKKELYCNDAAILNNVIRIKNEMMYERIKKGRRSMAAGFWTRAFTAVKSESVTDAYPNTLPGNEQSFVRKINKYVEDGYESLVSKKHGNQNTLKITDEQGEWIIARFATPIGRLTLPQLLIGHNEKAIDEGWKQLASVETLRNYLYRPDIKPKWYGTRYGELKYKEKYIRQNRTEMPTMRDSLWYSDGTKLNYFYQYRDEQNRFKIGTCMVYEVGDAFSEKLLGYHISESEDFEAQFYAFKMAVQSAGHKPYEMRYDNQGGHKKLYSSNFLGKLAHLNIPTQPYNGKSKTIESMFNRLQRQHLKQDWFFTGMNITANMLESHPNMEFILANKHDLPTLDEVKKRYQQRRNEWNEAKHYATGKSRNEMYYSSTNPETELVELWDMVDMFWLTTAKPSTYTAAGIEIQVKKQSYAYEVLTDEGMPDLEFLSNNVEAKFYVKYDPADMSMVCLYDLDSSGSMRFVAQASTYLKVHRNIQEQEPWEAEFFKLQQSEAAKMRITQKDEIEGLMEKAGVHPAQHGLQMPKIKGLNKKRAEAMATDIGTYTKNISNMVYAGLDDNAGIDELL